MGWMCLDVCLSCCKLFSVIYNGRRNALFLRSCNVLCLISYLHCCDLWFSTWSAWFFWDPLWLEFAVEEWWIVLYFNIGLYFFLDVLIFIEFDGVVGTLCNWSLWFGSSDNLFAVASFGCDFWSSWYLPFTTMYGKYYVVFTEHGWLQITESRLAKLARGRRD